MLVGGKSEKKHLFDDSGATPKPPPSYRLGCTILLSIPFPERKEINSLNNGYVEGSFISLLEPVGAPADPKSVVRNLVAPRIL